MQSEVSGPIPAAFVPFNEDQSINETGFQNHIEELDKNEFVSGILVNGHAGEQYALSYEERAHLVGLASEVADKPIYSGVRGKTASDVVNDIERVDDAGAKAAMVESSPIPIHGRPAAAMQYFEQIADGSSLPVVVFQIAERSGRNFDSELLAQLAGIDNVVAVKEGVWDVDHTMSDARALRESDADVNLLLGNDEHLLPGYALGSDGAVAELLAAYPNLVGELYESVKAGDMARAQSIHYELEPMLDVIYQEPKHDASIRLKVALELRGRLPTSIPRKPAVPIPEREIEEIEAMLDAADLL